MALDLVEIQNQIIALIQDESEDVTLEDLTQEVLEGGGVFDTLMRAMSNHLEKEHSANRITGDQYAQVYTAALTQVLQQSVAFLLGKGKFRLERALTLLQLAKLDKEIALLCQRLVTEKAQVMDATVLDPTADVDTSYQDPETGEYYFNTIQNIEGTIGRKNGILERQRQGYQDDYKTKASQLILDAYKIIFSNVPDIGSYPEELKNPSIDQLIEHLKLDTDIVTGISSDTQFRRGTNKDGYIKDDQLKYTSASATGAPDSGTPDP
jgi:hypothetical protein